MAKMMECTLPSGMKAKFRVLGIMAYLNMIQRVDQVQKDIKEDASAPLREVLKATLVSIQKPGENERRLMDNSELQGLLIDNWMDPRDMATYQGVIFQVHNPEESDVGNAMASLSPIVG